MMAAEELICKNTRLGNYQLLNRIGKGHLAEVWAARQTGLGLTVALKVIADKQGNNLIGQFEKEAASLAQLEHPNILNPVDYGYTGEYLYLAMPLAPGGTLEERQKIRRFSRAEAFQIFDQLLAGLAFAHSKGVIHGDLKPSNILFLTGDFNRLALTDFGLANTLRLNEDISLTLTGTITGAPEYMAPEQFTGQTSQASDQYAAGVILFELLTGQQLYQGATTWELGMRHTNDPLPLPHPDLPASLEPFFATALNKSPQRRFKNIPEMRAAFARAVARLSAEKPVILPSNPTYAAIGQNLYPQQPPATRFTDTSPAPRVLALPAPAKARPSKAGVVRRSRNGHIQRNLLLFLAALLVVLASLWLILQPQILLLVGALR